MMANNYRITVASPPDREKLVAEIFVGDCQWAELNQENSQLEIEFYEKPDGKPWKFSLDDTLTMLQDAKKRLIG